MLVIIFSTIKNIPLPIIDYPLGILDNKTVRLLKFKYLHKERDYENISTCIANFKKIVTKIGDNTDNYVAVLDTSKSKKVGVSSKYFFFNKNRIPNNLKQCCYEINDIKKITSKGSNNSMFVSDLSIYEFKPTTRDSFKKMCSIRNIDFEDFIEIFYGYRGKKQKIYNYLKIDKNEVSYE